MSDEIKKTILNTLAEPLANSAKNIIDKPTQNMGTTIADIWYLVFGGISQAADKKKLKYSYALQEFENELKEKISKIPEDKLVEPDIQVVAPALQALKYCVEKDNLRKMFSNLISSSMSNEFFNYVKPGFSNIILQLSPFDASVFSTHLQSIFNPKSTDIDNMNVYLTFRISEILLNNPSVPYPLFYLKEDKVYRINESVIDSLQNLLRLGLIYTNEYKIPIEYLQKYNIKVIRKSDNLFASLYSTCLTNFGINFALACCEKINISNFFEENVNGILTSIICDKSSLEYSCK